MPDSSICRLQYIFSIGLILAANVACAQDYPNRTIRIVTGTAGSNVANSSRFVAQGLAPALGQPVILDNRGGGAVVHAEIVSKAPADGYTLLLTGNGFWTGPLLNDKITYDPIRDFSPVSLVASAPGLIVVHSSLPVKSITDLIALAKSRPGQLNYGTGGTGGITHIAAEIFKAMAGVNIVRVPYTSDAVQISDLLSGQVEMTFAATNVAQHIKAGKLKALAVTSLNPSPLFPGLPAAAASLPGYSALATNAMLVSARTPAAIVHRLNQEVVRVLNLPATKELFLSAGLEATGSSPEQLSALIKAEIDTVGKIIRNAGIRAN